METGENLNGWCTSIFPSIRLIVFFKDGKSIHAVRDGVETFKAKGTYYAPVFRPATEEEIEKLLFSYCKRYIGAEYKCLFEPEETATGKFKKFSISYSGDVWADFTHGVTNMICDSKGNWAKIQK